ncbi:hypothetical protein [Streptomyces sp. NPDC047000]|uniref:hypothetical protein n=1 Tax=Streptomyces sp. NPDC047000 TaxID=3155474 RepID=UPI0033C8711A
MSIFAWFTFAVITWMAYSVWRMRLLPAQRRWLPFVLLIAGVASVVSGSDQSVGTPADRTLVVSGLVLILISWVVSLKERRGQGKRPSDTSSNPEADITA